MLLEHSNALKVGDPGRMRDYLERLMPEGQPLKYFAGLRDQFQRLRMGRICRQIGSLANQLIGAKQLSFEIVDVTDLRLNRDFEQTYQGHCQGSENKAV